MTAVSLRLPDELKDRLDRLAKLTGRSKTFYMVEAISEKLEDLEDLYLAEQRTLALPSLAVETRAPKSSSSTALLKLRRN